MDISSRTTYYSSASSRIPIHASYDMGGLNPIYSNEEYSSSSTENEIQKLYILADIAKEKFAQQEHINNELQTRVTLLEAQFTTLQNFYYKKFEE